MFLSHIKFSFFIFSSLIGFCGFAQSSNADLLASQSLYAKGYIYLSKIDNIEGGAILVYPVSMIDKSTVLNASLFDKMDSGVVVEFRHSGTESEINNNNWNKHKTAGSVIQNFLHSFEDKQRRLFVNCRNQTEYEQVLKYIETLGKISPYFLDTSRVSLDRLSFFN